MWPHAYFPRTYFAARYWAKLGLGEIIINVLVSFFHPTIPMHPTHPTHFRSV